MPRTYTEWLLLALLIAGISLGILHQPSWAIIVISIDFVLAVISYTEVPSSPKPSVAMPVILNKRYALSPYSIGEGPVFRMLIIENLIIRDYLPVVLPFKFDGVRCLLNKDGEKIPGGLVTVEGSMTIIPDIDTAERFMSFLNKGGNLIFMHRDKNKPDADPDFDVLENASPIVEQLFSMLGQSTREYGGTMTWDMLTFSKAVLSVRLITMLTGIGPDSEDEEVIKEFLAHALTDGVAEVHDLGIKITRLNIAEIQPEGRLAEKAEKAALELLERTAENTDIQTGLALAERILRKWIGEGEWNSLPLAERLLLVDKAMGLARIERGKATEIFLRTSDRGRPVQPVVLLGSQSGANDNSHPV